MKKINDFFHQNKYINKKELLDFINKNKIKLQLEEKTAQHNFNFIKQELKKHKTYFDNMFEKIDKNINLDYEQRKAIICDEDYILIVAGAGSGKTTTMAGKVKYLVDIKKIKEKQILMISFTNKAVDELKERVLKNFNINCDIVTFHKLGLKIIKSKKTIISELESKNIIKEYFKKELIENKNFNLYDYIENISLINKCKFIFEKCKFFLNITNQKEYEKFLDKTILNYFSEFIDYSLDFIKKVKNFEIKDFSKIKTKNNREIEKLTQIYNFYEENKKEKIDFSDMINLALKNIKNITKNYKYIIIDEYQDISKQRYDLIKKMSEKMQSKVFAVGDDWQSIFSFSGSDVNLFTEFKKMFGYAEELQITNTYRNSQELIDIAGKFINQNKSQINKKLFSKKHQENPLTIYFYNNQNKITKLLEIIKEININNSKENILLIGRYNKDIDFLLKSKKFKMLKNDKIISIDFPKIDITYLTAHKSKGLGFDNVIIINSKNSKYGFPSKIKNKIIFDLIKEETIEFAEERRLFYVAITRTKNKIYILSPKTNPSEFIVEIKKYKNVITK